MATTFGLSKTIEMTDAIPEIANRIFTTKADAETYISEDELFRTAIPGLVIRVINDGANNGVYWTLSRDDGSLYLTKLFDENALEWGEIK